MIDPVDAPGRSRSAAGDAGPSRARPGRAVARLRTARASTVILMFATLSAYGQGVEHFGNWAGSYMESLKSRYIMSDYIDRYTNNTVALYVVCRRRINSEDLTKRWFTHFTVTVANQYREGILPDNQTELLWVIDDSEYKDTEPIDHRILISTNNNLTATI